MGITPGWTYPRWQLGNNNQPTGLVGPDGSISYLYSKVVASLAIPVGVPSSGTIGNNGALTVTTAFAGIYSTSNIAPGIWLYFPTGAVYSGSVADFYWTVMSSTTQGTIYNNRLNGEVPSIPASPTAIVATGPGAYTTPANTDLTITVGTYPANSLGANGTLKGNLACSCTNTADTKKIWIGFGTSYLGYPGITTATGYIGSWYWQNRGVVNKQWVTLGWNGDRDESGLEANAESINSAVDQTLSVRLNIAANTSLNNLVCQHVEFTVNPI